MNLRMNIWDSSFFTPYSEERDDITGPQMDFKKIFSISLTFCLFFQGDDHMNKLERDYQSGLIKRIKDRFEGCMVLKNDARYIQGIPDLLVLYNDNWAALECKRERKSNRQPNQSYYVKKMDRMSYARVISPENEEDILDEMESTFATRRSTRISRSKQA